MAGIGAAAAAVSLAAADKEAKHVCKGMNECKGQGGGPEGRGGKELLQRPRRVRDGGQTFVQREERMQGAGRLQRR